MSIAFSSFEPSSLWRWSKDISPVVTVTLTQRYLSHRHRGFAPRDDRRAIVIMVLLHGTTGEPSSLWFCSTGWPVSHRHRGFAPRDDRRAIVIVVLLHGTTGEQSSSWFYLVLSRARGTSSLGYCERDKLIEHDSRSKISKVISSCCDFSYRWSVDMNVQIPVWMTLPSTNIQYYRSVESDIALFSIFFYRISITHHYPSQIMEYKRDRRGTPWPNKW